MSEQTVEAQAFEQRKAEGTIGHPNVREVSTEDVSVIVSVARGIGTGTGRRMSDRVWEFCKSELRSIVRETCGPLVADGEGTWWSNYSEHDQGVFDTEDNYSVTAGRLPENEFALRATLSIFAYLYGQDSVGFIIARPKFIEPEEGRALTAEQLASLER